MSDPEKSLREQMMGNRRKVRAQPRWGGNKCGAGVKMEGDPSSLTQVKVQTIMAL